MNKVDELAAAAIASTFDDEFRAAHPEVQGCDWKSVSIIARKAVENALEAAAKVAKEWDVMSTDEFEAKYGVTNPAAAIEKLKVTQEMK